MTSPYSPSTSCGGFVVGGDYCFGSKVHNTSFCATHLKQNRDRSIDRCNYTEGHTPMGGVEHACTQKAVNDDYPFRCKVHLGK